MSPSLALGVTETVMSPSLALGVTETVMSPSLALGVTETVSNDPLARARRTKTLCIRSDQAIRSHQPAPDIPNAIKR
jgi:hypothetical protein